MTLQLPPDDAVSAITAATTDITRRVEIYEADGVTRWMPDLEISITDGTVTVSNSRDERRTIDLTLDNTDGSLTNRPGGFWYDKIIKVYAGVSWEIFNFVDPSAPPVGSQLYPPMKWDEVRSLKWGQIATQKWNQIHAINNPTWGSLKNLGTTWGSLRTQHWGALKKPAKNNPTWGELKNAGVKWGDLTGSRQSTPPHGLKDNVWDPLGITGISFWKLLKNKLSTSGGQLWGAITRPPNNEPPVPLTPQTFYWECQVGEFMIDSIEIANFPHLVSIAGRDYTKKLLLSLLPNAATFAAGTPVEQIIQTMGLNAGLTKFRIPNTGIVLTADYKVDRGATRWSVCSDLSTAYSIEVFVDPEGYLTVQPFQDPTTSPEIFTFATGEPDGNLVTYKKKSTDAQIFNHVVATGEGTENSLVAGEALNTEVSSPTNIDTLGDRTYLYTSALITAQDQAVTVAKTLLAIMALESFEVDMESIVFPWLEVGYVVQFVDPDYVLGEPVRYLLTDFSIPVHPAAMSLTTKRVTIVGA